MFIGVAQRHRDNVLAALDTTYTAVSSHRLEVRPDGRRRSRESGE
jgi:hypothetical protein